MRSRRRLRRHPGDRRGAGDGAARTSRRVWCRARRSMSRSRAPRTWPSAARILRMTERERERCESDKVSTCMPSARAITSCSAACESRTTGRGGALGRRRGDSRAVRRRARRARRRRHRPAFPRQRSASIAAPTAACSCARVAELMRAAGLKLVNADITVLAEAPRIAAHRAAMAANLAADLGASRRSSSTSRPPPPSGWDSSAAARDSRRRRRCCSTRVSAAGRRLSGSERARQAVPGRLDARGLAAAASPRRAAFRRPRSRPSRRISTSRSGCPSYPPGEGRTGCCASRSARPTPAGWPPKSRGWPGLPAARWDTRAQGPACGRRAMVQRAGTTQAREFWQAVRTAEFKVLEAHANLRKLKRGALSGNRFRIRLRNVAWPREQLEAKLEALRAHGAPNYFGPQRFGRDGRNLDRVADWLERGVKPARPRRARVRPVCGPLAHLQCGSRASGGERELGRAAARRSGESRRQRQPFSRRRRRR